MLHFYDRAGFARALTLDLDPNLHRLLVQRIGALDEDLIDYTEYLVVGAEDTEEDVQRVIGFSPLVEPIEGFRFGESGFQPGWDNLLAHDGWFEMTISFGSTFAYVLLIDAGNATFNTLCGLYASRSEPVVIRP